MYKYDFASLPEIDAFLKKIEDKKNKGDKNVRIMFEKITYCIERVRLQGTRAGTRIIKDLKGKENDNLYELRPLDERIFMCLSNGITLSCCLITRRMLMKQTSLSCPRQDD